MSSCHFSSCRDLIQYVLFLPVTSVTHPTEEHDTHICTVNYYPHTVIIKWDGEAETSICVDQFHDPSIPIELWHLERPRGRVALKSRHIRIGQTAQRHFAPADLPIAQPPIKGIHVATGNNQFAFTSGRQEAITPQNVPYRHLHATSDGWTSSVT